MPGRDKLAEFAEWCASHISGDAKGEAQIFLDNRFQVFGHAGGLTEGGATLEMRVSKADGGGTNFADVVWKPIVLVKMKKRGENLQRHYRQAFDHSTRLGPNRPRYAVLCNFDEFRVYDFDNQEVAAKIEKGEPVMPPGVPKNYPDARKLATGDCIRPTLI